MIHYITQLITWAEGSISMPDTWGGRRGEGTGTGGYRRWLEESRPIPQATSALPTPWGADQEVYVLPTPWGAEWRGEELANFSFLSQLRAGDSVRIADNFPTSYSFYRGRVGVVQEITLGRTNYVRLAGFVNEVVLHLRAEALQYLQPVTQDKKPVVLNKNKLGNFPRKKV